ncbi:scarecrow-like protein 34 [Miscanthus floridulus]|uniref:scarecrow-like protein 34 n=1 Tax=Miscanthus floridulus TaxID=154761 RepID=UPI00345A3FB7
MAATLEELVGLVEPSPQSPSVFLHLPPTPHHDNGVPSSGQQQQQEDVALEHISRLLMEEEEDMHGMFLRNDDPALLRAQQNLAQIIASSSSSTSNGASDLYKDGNNSTVSNMCATATGAEPCSVMDLLNMAFVKGREEGCKFLPKENKRLVMKDITRNGRLEADAETTGRACKLMATMARPEEEAQVQELIGRMMLDDCEVPTEEMERLRAAMADEAAMSNSREARRRRQQQVDMRTLLVRCAQAVDERHGARELLEQAKQHASPTGDATQRLAHCFVEALEARLAGTGSVLHRSLPALDTTTLLQGPEFLRAFRLFNATCCFQRVGFAFANMTICRAAAGSSRLHVVDYGLHLGLQWPGLLRRLAARDGGPPEVTITCIDLPLPGFRPARHIEETGHMLSDCARELGVPFKFHAAAAARWNAVRVEVDPGAVLVVNSLFKLETLTDDSLVVDRASPRDSVLAGIRRMRPAVFTHGVVNGLCGNSFLTRFREALFYFSAAFDMLDATLPRNSEQRMVLERDFLRACVVNVVACEGRDRTDRFDTYRQWQQRSRRAGLRQLPLDPAVVGAVRVMVEKQCYHREFVIDENDGWLLQGWKGRFLYAHSTWVADES